MSIQEAKDSKSQLNPVDHHEEKDQSIEIAEMFSQLLPRWKTIVLATIASGTIAFGISNIIPPTFTARLSFLSPQPQQSSAASALASLGALSSLASAGGGIKSQADQYIALMQSATVSDRLIERFKLMETYNSKFRIDARRELADNVRISAGKKDNLITVEVDDQDPQRAADIANAYILELKKLSDGLALTESQQRRMFFEQHLEKAKISLSTAQSTLQKTGFNAGAIKSEPKAAADAYAKTKAETSATELRLMALRRSMTDSAPEVQSQLAILTGLRKQLSQLEQPIENSGNQDYVSAYREFKYQEALFDVFARQFEMAKIDESRDGALFQVVDMATMPEKKSKPKRSLFAIFGALLGLILTSGFLLVNRNKNSTTNNLAFRDRNNSNA